MPAKKNGAKKIKNLPGSRKSLQKSKTKISNESQKILTKKSISSSQPSGKIIAGELGQILMPVPLAVKVARAGVGHKFYDYSLTVFSFFMCISFVSFIPTVAGFYSDYEIQMLNLDRQASKLSMKYVRELPKDWGEVLPGIMTHFYTNKKELVLTLDACGGKNGSLADKKLIDFLIDNKIKATLFVNARWIAKNRDLLSAMVATELFDIENHGFSHHPLSVTPQMVYGIKGVGSPTGVVYEVEVGAMVIKNFVGKNPRYFRSGAAYYDDVSLKILKDLGYKAVAYSINADEGATLPAHAVYAKTMKATSGNIIIAHMNRPDKGSGAGLIAALADLSNDGYSFLKLTEVN